jgi:thiamine biosynthesis protein ThiI
MNNAIQEVLLIKYGEIALRGGNRRIYEDMLMNAIRKNLRSASFAGPSEHEGFTVYKEQGRFVVRNKNISSGQVMPNITPLVSCIFGITSVCPAIRLTSWDLDDIMSASLAYAKEHCKPESTFRVTVKRADKSYPGRSDEIARQIGAFLLESFLCDDGTEGLTVNLHQPDFHLVVEIRNDVFIYSLDAEVAGPGGLPPSSAGRGVLLLSGGIDSPVAGYLAAKRGIELTAVYFHSPPYTSERAKEKVIDIAKQLSRFTGKIKLIAVNFTEIQLLLTEHTPPEKITILLKRAMLKMADMTAAGEKALALITGDAVGQVASQTLHSLHAMAGTSNLPILRPLACFDKKDIINLAKQIGTYSISIRPFDDCCTLFLPKHPETKPKLSIIQSIEKSVPGLEELMQQALTTAEVYKL